MITIDCLETIITSGSKTYPIYIGFATASDILKIAKVPSFQRTTQNFEIANNVLSRPVKDWQRPLDIDRRDRIASVFDNTGEFMPNPVLLSENVSEHRPEIKIKPKMISGQIYSNEIVVEINEPTIDEQKPLWIIDGQHRINGLAISQQSNNFIPVVLLLNKGQNFYNGPILAKIFAQVTTSAEKLDDIHNEWLTYAFSLNRYKNNIGLNNSMTTVVKLCSISVVQNINNPFHNQITFNKKQFSNPSPGGFHYNCIELTDLFYENYYNCSPSLGIHLSPDSLLEQIVFAHDALRKVVTNHNSSVFFGQDDFWHKIMTDAFFVGILNYLLTNIPLTSSSEYEVLLRDLNFAISDWNFKGWIRSLSGGSNQSNSKEIAFAFFREIFRTLRLPVGVRRIDDFFRGNNASIEIGYYSLNSRGKINLSSQYVNTYSRGAIQTETISPRNFIKLEEKTLNIGILEVTDMQSSPGNPTKFNIKKGFELKPGVNNPLVLEIRIFHYGDIQSKIDLNIQW